MPTLLPRPATVLSSLLLCSLFSSQAAGEGAVRHIACTMLSTCDESGNCAGAQGDETRVVSFELAPNDVAPDGSGSWKISYADTSADMQSQSDAGPFSWTTTGGRERHTLVASSETRFLWHTLSLQGAPASTIRFMACTFTQ